MYVLVPALSIPPIGNILFWTIVGEVNIPVTTAPEAFAWTFTSLPFFNDDASIPVKTDPSPLNCVAVFTS